MLAENKFKILLDLVNSASKDELIWMNGYLNGMVQSAVKTDVPASAPNRTAGVNKITIVYGTETGNTCLLLSALTVRVSRR